MEKKHGALTDNLCMVKKTNYNSIDLFKFIMAIFVVAIHTGPEDSTDIQLVKTLTDAVTELAVPFFFLASGFLLALKFKGEYYDKRNIPVVVRYLKHILKIYLIWTAIYLPVGIYAYVQNGYGIGYSVLITVRRIVFRGQHENIQMLWYLLSTIYAALFILIMMKLKAKPKLFGAAAYAMLILAAFFNFVSEYEQPLPIFLPIIKQLLTYTIVEGGVLSGLAYIPFGILVFKSERVKKYSKYLFLPAFILMLFIKNRYLQALFEPVEMISFFSLVLSIRLKDRPCYKLMRNSSLNIYLLHMYVYMGFSYIVFHELRTGFICFVGTSVITSAASFTYAYISDRVKEKKKITA